MAAGAGGVVALALVARTVGEALHADQKALRDAATERHAPISEMDAMARAAMLRHPAEPYLPFITSVRALRERDDNPIPWIGATLERALVYGPAHLVLARVLAPRSQSQARLEYRLAIEQAPTLVTDVMTEAPRLVRSYFDAIELVPEGRTGAIAEELLVRAVSDRLPATGVRIDADLLRVPAIEWGPFLRAAGAAVADLEAAESAPWCQGSAWDTCVSDAMAKSRRVEQGAPEQCEGYLLSARARVASGDSAGGLVYLEKAADSVINRVSCLQQVVEVAREAGNEPRADVALEKIVAAGCRDSAECAGNLRWVGQQYEATGRPLKALAIYRRALEQSPDDVLLAHLAALAGRAGLHAEAAEDYEQLAHRHPGEAEWHRLAMAEHDAAMREAVRL